ncbi:hypothetical protein AQ809_00100 [Burkholderia pseudomallei]|nr:hypothetical protein AQ809_00100 [Burkholderia pseudomallei]OMW53458.1 hypothetical protein AQ811_06795 [Burkholderia pseudomallei]
MPGGEPARRDVFVRERRAGCRRSRRRPGMARRASDRAGNARRSHARAAALKRARCAVPMKAVPFGSMIALSLG